MRLLSADGNGISLTEFFGTDVPCYAILSHTWGSDSDEVTFKDLLEGTGRSKSGYEKIRFCAERALTDCLTFFWIDTCCIDKSSSAELSEAINSMFYWYQGAAKCYVYLSDVHDENKYSFQDSRWFKRGWTLQELVAPTIVEFYTVEGKQIGNKSSRMQEISNITTIPTCVLRGCPLSEIDIEERLSWTRTRTTKREEDMAYSLMGIFDVHMPLIYGEGHKKAFNRLKEEIDRDLFRIPDETGIALDSSTSGFNGLSQTRNVKNRTRAHITGRTGNIKASGRTRVANTGISIKNSCQTMISARITGKSGSVEVGEDSGDLNTGICI